MLPSEKASRNQSPTNEDRKSVSRDYEKLRNNTADSRFRPLHVGAECDSFELRLRKYK